MNLSTNKQSLYFEDHPFSRRWVNLLLFGFFLLIAVGIIIIVNDSENLISPLFVYGSLSILFLILCPFNKIFIILFFLFQWHQNFIPAFFSISDYDIRLCDLLILVLGAKILVEKRNIELKGKLPLLIFLYLITGLFSELNALLLFSKWDFIWTLKQYVKEIEGVTLFIFTLCYIKRLDDIKKLFRFFVIAGIIHSIIVISKIISGSVLSSVVGKNVMIFIPAFAYLGASFFAVKSKAYKVNNKKLLLFIMAFILFGAIMTTRMTVLIGILSVIFSILLTQRRNKIIYIFFVVILIILFNIVRPNDFRELYESIEKMSMNQLQYSSTSIRFSYWLTAIEIWKDHPFIGTGMGGFGILQNTEYIYKFFMNSNFFTEYNLSRYDVSSKNLEAHNFFFQILADRGTIGIVLFIFILYHVWRLCRRRYLYFGKTNEEIGIFYYTIYLTIIGYSVSCFGMSLIYYSGIGLSYMFWVILGILHALENISKRTTNEVNPKPDHVSI